MKQDLYLNAADHMPGDGSRDVSDDIQRLIDGNPNRVIFFPDGLYRIAKPVLTPADPAFSVSLGREAMPLSLMPSQRPRTWTLPVL